MTTPLKFNLPSSLGSGASKSSLSSGSSTTGGSLSGLGGLSSASKTSGAAGTATPSVNAPPSPAPTPAEPPISTIGYNFSPTTFSMKSVQGTDKQYRIQSIACVPQYQAFSMMELRAFDYVKNKMIDPIPNPIAIAAPPPTPAAGGIGAKGLFSGATAVSAAESGKTTTYTTSNTFGAQNKAPQVSMNNIIFPQQKVAPVETAVAYFDTGYQRYRQDDTVAEDDHLVPLRKVDLGNLFSQKNKNSDKVTKPKVSIKPEMLKCALPSQMDMSVPQRRNGPNSVQISPSLEDTDNLEEVNHFRIWRDGYAQLEFLEKSDVSKFSKTRDVEISLGYLDVYPNKNQMPSPGKGINVSCKITFYKVFPRDPINGIRQKGPQSPNLLAFRSELVELCRSKGAVLDFYDCDRGVLQITVDDFNNFPIKLP